MKVPPSLSFPGQRNSVSLAGFIKSTMASVFGHVAASSALGMSFFPKYTRWGLLALAGFCAFAPDLDVIAFRFGIPYTSIWGHRGFTHSLAFALLFGALMAWLFCRKEKDWWKIAIWFVAATASHPLLDMMTTGGLGCALWWPFSNERLFFSFRPILVSPLEVRSFIGKYGLRVLVSELVWVGIPGLFLVLIPSFWRRNGEK